MTAGDWAALVIGIAAVVLAMVALPHSPYRGRVLIGSALLILLAVVIASFGSFSREGASKKIIETPESTTILPSTTGSAPLVSPTSPSSEFDGFSPSPTESATYLEDLPYTHNSDPYDTRGVAKVNGREYARSQGAQFCFGSDNRSWEYDLGRDYGRFHAILGLNDDSTPEAVVRYEVLGDGNLIASRDISFGEDFPLDVSVNGMLRLKLVTTLLTKEGTCRAATAEWAEARAVG